MKTKKKRKKKKKILNCQTKLTITKLEALYCIHLNEKVRWAHITILPNIIQFIFL